ncbi:MAG: hypothetical protein EZS28_047384, partial [Streblomastix strix]
MDIGGKADPFVVFRIGDKEKKTTTAKNTLNYDYINETYEIAYDPAVTQEKKVDIEVFDYDSITNNDLIGIANMDQIEVELFLQPKKSKNEQSQTQLKGTKSDQGLGKVIFWMLYTPGDEWIKKYEEEALRKKKEDEQIRKNKELE